MRIIHKISGKFFFLYACLFFFFIMIQGLSADNPGKVLSYGNTLKEWKIREQQNAQPAIQIIKMDKKDVLEVRFNFSIPDMNKVKLFTGLHLELVKDFEFRTDEVLLLRILWEGGENYLKIDFEDDGHKRFKEFTHLHQCSGWQDLSINYNDLEIVNGSKLGTGKLGQIKKVIFTVFYSWGKGPGRFLIDEIKIIKQQPQIYPDIAVSQLGYRPSDPKFAVVKWRTAEQLQGRFRIMSVPESDVILEQELIRQDFSDWQAQFFKGDFSELTKPGCYQVEINFNNSKWHQSCIFEIKEHIYEEKTVKLNFAFFKDMHSDDPRIFSLPDLGGYRDTGTMYARYMNTNPHAVYGISSYVLAKNLSREQAQKILYAIQELIYGVKSMIAWQKDDGSVINSVIREPDLYPHNQFAYDNTYPWKTTELIPMYQYAAAMARASRALMPYDRELAEKALAAAEKSYDRLLQFNEIKNSGVMGNFLWDCIELYQATQKQKYLDKAKELAAKLIERQFLDFTRTPRKICGNISYSRRSIDFIYQYKLVHEAGIYFGLIELFSLLAPDDSLYGDLHYCLRTFINQYLLTMSVLTPYNQIAEGLEMNQDKTFRISYFHPPTGRLGVQGHGLNCDHLAYALMGLRLVTLLDDPRLITFAVNQLQWIFGVNPLGISMMSGIGIKQGESLDEYLGLHPVPGGIMNGLVGHNGILPYWAHHWVSGEYWIPHNAFFTAVLGELESPGLEEYEKNLNKDRKTGSMEAVINVPEKISGDNELKLSLEISNKTDKEITVPCVIRVRGSYYYDQAVNLTLKAGEKKELARTISPSGQKAPCLISFIAEKQLISEKYLLPQFPAFIPLDLSKLIKYKPVSATASSEQKNEKNVFAANLIDGDRSTRWSSEFSDPQWVIIDLGSNKNIKKIDLYWENAYGETYEIQISNDNSTWKIICRANDEDGGTDEIILDKAVQTRYIRIMGFKRGTPYGFSLFEADIFGEK